MSIIRTRLVFSIATLIVASILTWLIVGETSPLNEYFLWHVTIPNYWRLLNLIPAVISAVVAGNAHSGNMVVFILAFVIQWFGVGWVLSYFFTWFRK